MNAPNLVNRHDLLQWADTVAASSELPRLVRRLVLETGRGIAQLTLPAGEGVRAGDWDGTLRTTEAAPYIPLGLSVWEVSVEKSPGTKADKDYSKRDNTPDGSSTEDCTYIEVILRPWTKRQAWARERTAEGKWKEVRSFGVDDIETWLENAPVTHAWISHVLGRNPYGLRPVDLWWNAWSAATTTVLKPTFILAGRTEAQEQLLARLKGSPQVTTIKGGSLEELQAFIAAAMLQAESAEDNEHLNARAAFVDDLGTWRELLARPNPLILIAASDQIRTEPLPAASPHHIVILLADASSADIEIAPLDPSETAASLKEAGVDDQKADRLARLARRSLLAMRREIAVKPELHQPTWARPPIDRSLRSMLLVGRWHKGREGDKEVLTTLSGRQYDDLQEAASRLSAEADPVVGQIDAVWALVSAYDAWSLLAGRLQADDLQRFGPIAQEVLGEVDPSLGLPKSDRWWRASIEGKVHQYSPDLRKGVASTLALLSVHGDRVDAGSGMNGGNWASLAVRKLLDDANADQTCNLWISLTGLLPHLAEAAPDEFLACVERGLEDDPPLLLGLFKAEVDSSIGGSAPHTGMLWALEAVAWSGPHFGRSVDLLARFAEIDPGGRLSNRPAASLSTIFKPWHPDNSVDVSRRLKVLDALRRRHSQVAWNLMLTMLPEMHGVHFPSYEPNFRNWKPPRVTVSYGEYFQVVTGVVTRLVEDARDDLDRWIKLVEQFPNLTPQDRQTVLDALQRRIGSGDFSEDDKAKLWESLRSVTAQHRKYSDTEWALQEEELKKLDRVQALVQPSAPIELGAWLFQDYHPPLPGHSVTADFQEYQTALEESRKEVAARIDESEGYDALRLLAVRAIHASWVGIAIADATDAKYEDDLLLLIGSEDAVDAELGASFAARSFTQHGWPWLEGLLESRTSLTPAQRAILLLQTHDFPKSWQRADELGEEIARQFWNRFQIYGLGDFTHIAYTAGRLMKVDRNAAALGLVEIYLEREGVDRERLAGVAVAGLEALLHGDDSEIGILRQYDFERLFNLFYEYETSIGWERIARLEWQYLPALGYDANPRMLGRLLARDPSFFVDLISVVYRQASAEDPPQPSPEAERKAINGYRLLDDWSISPGMGDDGHLDSRLLSNWISHALQGLEEADRRDVGARAIGRVLAKAPSDPDGTWPCIEIRDLFQEMRSEKLEAGFYTAVLNNRGATTRSLDAGGAPERALAADYREKAENFNDEWPRTAALLRSLAENYERDARGEDNSAERFRSGLED